MQAITCSDFTPDVAVNLVERKEAIAKLKELKLQFDILFPHNKQNLSFFKLLNDPTYRQLHLLTLSYQHDALLRARCNDLLTMNIQGSLFKAMPELGSEVRIYLYPANKTLTVKDEQIQAKQPAKQFLFYGVAEHQ